MSDLYRVENAMDPDTHSFIIKIWMGDGLQQESGSDWRGHITHVPSGERHYFKTLEEIPVFIQGYFASGPWAVGR